MVGLAAALLALVLAGGASAATVDIPAEIVIESQAHPGPNDPGRCIAVSFMQFAEVPGATAYEGLAAGSLGSSDVHGSGPPFPNDHYSLFPAVFDAPAGVHRFALGSSSVGSGCGDAVAGQQGRFSVVYMHAVLGSGNQSPAASFTVTRSAADPRSFSFDGGGSSDPDGRIVSYAWDFNDGATATGATAQHAYAAGGRRTVTLTVTDDQGATGSRTIPVDVPFAVTGTLTERRCRPAGCQVRFVQGIRVAASGPGSEEATTDALGGYRLFLTAGSWTLTPDQPAGTSAWDPPSRTLSVGADLAGQDFARCATPPGASAATATAAAAAPAADACSVQLSGRVVSAVDGSPFGQYVSRNHFAIRYSVVAVDVATGSTGGQGLVDASGGFTMRVPRARYRLRIELPDASLLPVHVLPSEGVPVNANRDQGGIEVPVRPTIGNTISLPPSFNQELPASLHVPVYDFTGFGVAGPEVVGGGALNPRPPRPPGNQPWPCSLDLVAYPPTAVLFEEMTLKTATYEPRFAPPYSPPPCVGHYNIRVGAERTDANRIELVAAFEVDLPPQSLFDQVSVPLQNVRYFGQFRR
jgi:PKD repeat protein